MLLAVLVVVVLGALMGTIALEQSSITATNARLSLERRAARGIAWSGVRGIMSELEAQRSELLRGEDPEVTGEWTLYEDGATVGRVRLLPIGGEDGPNIESESAKVNLNAATGPMLARLGGLGAERGASVRTLAEGGGIGSVEDLRRVGIDPADEAGLLGGVSIERLATAYSIDPDVGAAVGDGGSAGKPRARWDATAAAFDRRTVGSRAVSEAVERLVAAGVDLSSAEATASALRDQHVEPALWGAVWDEIGFAEDEAGREGLVDITRAPEAVLACVPGFEGRAADMVRAREGLSGDRLRSPTWPLDAGIVSAEEMASALPWVTMRTLHWRVRIAGEVVRSDGDGVNERVIATVVLEAVIDVSGSDARVAYLRDVTFGEAVVGIDAMLADEFDSDGESASEQGTLVEEAGTLATAPPEGDDGASESPEELEPMPPASGGPETPTQPGRAGGRQRGRWTAGSR